MITEINDLLPIILRLQAQIRKAVVAACEATSLEAMSSIAQEEAGDTIYALAQQGLALGICCHPYDLCTELIAREMGVLVTDERGRPLHAPLDTESDVTWIGYANEAIRQQMEPLLQKALARRGLLEIG